MEFANSEMSLVTWGGQNHLKLLSKLEAAHNEIGVVSQL